MGGNVEFHMKLSIVIPCYNVEKYVERCIDSIAHQIKDKEVEVIMVDDGSRDSTVDKIKSLQSDYPFITLLQQSNAGPATARNKGVERAKGEYIWFIDSDDFISEDAFEVLWPRLSEGFDIIAFNIVMNEHSGLKKMSPYPSTSVINAARFVEAGAHFACNRIFKKELFDRVKLPEGIINFEDFVFNMLVSQYVDKVLTLSNHIYIYERTNVNATTLNVNKRHLIRIHRDILKGHKMLLERQHEIDDEELRRSYVKILNRSFSVCILSLFRSYNCRFIRRAIDTYSSWGVYPFKYGGNSKIKIFTFFINHKFLWPLHPLIKKLV